MRLESIFPSKYVRAADLNGKDVTLTIVKAEMVEMGHGTERETKLVLSFAKASKSLICNRTIAMTIAKLHGMDTDSWINQRITIFPTRVRAFGQTHEVVRVRESIPPAPKPAAIQATPPVEENDIDDQEDIVDGEEDGGGRQVDPSTGEILDDGPGGSGPSAQAESHALQPQGATGQNPGSDDDLWNSDAPAAANAKPKTLSQAQLTRLHILGADLYGKDWDAKRPALVNAATTGATTSSKELTPDEASLLIRGLETRLKAKKAAAATQPVANGKVSVPA